MEWREQSTVSCQDAYVEAQRWIEAVTKKTFKGKDFRSALESGVLLCDVINKIKPGIIKRVNRLPTPIAGLDNINVFLKACLKLGLKEAQLFHPGDLQDLSSRVTVNDEETDRRLRNVLITLYWLGRRAQDERSYDGPYLNFKAFEGLLGTALHKALHELSGQTGSSTQDSGLGDSWSSEQEERHQLKGRGGGHRRDDSFDSLDSLGSQTLSISSDATLKGSSEGCCSDAEADAAFRMADKESLSYRRSVSLTPKVTTQFNQFLPTKDKAATYVPAPLRKKRAERTDDNRRSWANPMDEDYLPITRQQQEKDSFDGSKSTNDITEEPVLVRRRSQYEALEKYREQIKQSDDKWQDDLSKWKNRRKSVNSDIVKKKEEREKVEQITYSSSTRNSKTFKEMQDEREKRRSGSLSSRIGLLSFDNDTDVFEKPKPHTRDSMTRSYTIDTYNHSSGSSEPAQKEVKPTDVSLRYTKQETESVKVPGRATARSSFSPPKPSEATSSFRSSVFESTARTKESSLLPKAPQKVPEPESPVKVQPPTSGSIFKPSLASKTDANAAAVSRITASLPRSYQRSDSARLSSVITPRPFGTQATRVGSLTRSVTLNDSNSRVNGNTAVPKNTSVPSRYHQFMTVEEMAQSQSSPVHSSEDDDDEEQEETTGKSVTSTSSISSRTVQVKRDLPANEASKESMCEMRISLNQKPNSSRDFGFDVAWDSSGAHVNYIQPGSPADIFQLQPGDEVLTLNSHRVADMNYLDWKAGMDRALQEGNLVMDIRRYGKSNWDRDPSSPPFKGHKTINLTSMDHTTLVGFPDAGATNMLDFTSFTDTSAKATTHSVVDVASNGVDGGYPKVSMMTKESEPISMINLKRRSEFFEKGSAGSDMPDIPVPPLTVSSTRWSWDPEEERRRQEKWQKEQERQLQEKYKRDQEKLQEEWTKAQEEISSSVPQREPAGPTLAYWDLEQERERLEQERKRREEEEQQERMKLELERQRREEEFERQRQEMRRREEELERERQEIERKRREQEQELERQRQEMRRREEELERQRQQEEERKRREGELERLKVEEERRKREAEEERQRQVEEERRKREAEEERQRQVEEERRKREAEEARQRQVEEEMGRTREKEEEERRQREEEELAWQKRREAEKEELRRRLMAAEEQERQERKRAIEEQRAKLLETEERLPNRVIGGDVVDAMGGQPPSQAELQRQQLLNDMKKKTNLLTDNSWIRQRSATAPSQSELPSTRRGGSLDHLDNPPNSWRSSWTLRSDSHIPNYSRPHSALSGSVPFYGDGPPGARFGSSTRPASFGGPAAGNTPWSGQLSSLSTSSLSPTTSPELGSDAGGRQQRSRSVSGKKVCTLCDLALGKGAAMIIESLGLCYHLTCFKCIDCKSALGGSEAGAEVRIRNKQLYCNTCYMRFKTGQPTSM
ncbi:LIM domain only protein 7 isoform X4 [Syngnathus scovelli]|uniref:LIM domain only protein 7 isoform X4 n=1 Tax=Syngnathus scovelli TaxID=161590 RepID=UPI0021109288|nr:LIM domain only protein 7 isoform X5 [Syngnathus scovelli]